MPLLFVYAVYAQLHRALESSCLRDCCWYEIYVLRVSELVILRSCASADPAAEVCKDNGEIRVNSVCAGRVKKRQDTFHLSAKVSSPRKT